MNPKTISKSKATRNSNATIPLYFLPKKPTEAHFGTDLTKSTFLNPELHSYFTSLRFFKTF